MKTYKDTNTGETMTYEEIAENYRYIQMNEPEVWDDVTVDEFIDFHVMCGDIEEMTETTIVDVITNTGTYHDVTIYTFEGITMNDILEQLQCQKIYEVTAIIEH